MASAADKGYSGSVFSGEAVPFELIPNPLGCPDKDDYLITPIAELGC